MPYPHKGQSKEDYISGFMDSKEANKDYKNPEQRIAVAESIWENKEEYYSGDSVEFEIYHL